MKRLSILLFVALAVACSADAGSSDPVDFRPEADAGVPGQDTRESPDLAVAPDVSEACVPECADGFECSPGRTCEDIDECARQSADCDPLAVCTNTEGGFECACPDGFSGDGRSCEPVDGCAQHDCDRLARCENLPDGYMCNTCDFAGVGEAGPPCEIPEAVLVKATNPDLYDQFGSVVAVSGDGNTLAVASVRERSAAQGIDGDQSDNSVRSAGAVYIYVRNGKDWTPQAYVKAERPSPGARFGSALGLSHDGDTLVVGVPGDDSDADGIDGDLNDSSAPGSGAVFVFNRHEEAWTQEAYIKAMASDSFDGFGTAVAVSASGDVVAVGAPEEASGATGVDADQTDNSLLRSGAAYVFTRNDDGWSQDTYIKPSNTAYGYNFGHSVALSKSGDTLAVGAFSQGVNADLPGAAYVFQREGGWVEQAFIQATNRDHSDRFGIDLALSGDGRTLAIGADGEDSSSTGIGGDETDNSGDNVGAVYVYRLLDGTWTRSAYVKASNAGDLDVFGHNVRLSENGSVLLVSAVAEDSLARGWNADGTNDQLSASGGVYVFRNDGQWREVSMIKAPAPDQDDHFGVSIDMSANAGVIVVGSHLESSSSMGVGGWPHDDSLSGSGAAFIYEP